MPVSYMEIDLRAFRHNLRVIRSHLKNVPALAVIKANAYGHDIFLIAKALYDFDVKVWAVARLSEAVDLCEYMKQFSVNDYKILVFESIEDFETLNKYPNIYPSINSIKDIKQALANNIL